MSDKKTKTSKFLSLVLRHEPGSIGIALDDAGWVAVHDLLEGCRRKGHAITFFELQQIVQSSDKQRFAFSQDIFPVRQRRLAGRLRADTVFDVPLTLCPLLCI